MENKRKKILIVSGRAFNLYRSRLPLMKLLLSEGWEVHAAALAHDGYEKKIVNEGVIFHHIGFVRAKVSFFKDIKSLLELNSVILKLAPDNIHFFNTKPILISGLLFFKKSKPCVTACTLTGIGFHAKTFKNLIITLAFKYSLSKKNIVVFENGNDKAFCVERNFSLPQKTVVQISSGVDIKKFEPVNVLKESINILFAGRLVKSKGINELLASAKKLKEKYPGQVCIKIAGEVDLQHPDGVNKEDIANAHENGIIEYLGVIPPDEMNEVMNSANIVVLPSYREGFSKVLMEAAASGKALAASDVPGCHEIVRHNQNGVLFESKNEEALFDALQYLVLNPDKILEFGNASRLKAEEFYDQNVLAKGTYELY